MRNLSQKIDQRQIYSPKMKYKMAAAIILNLLPVAIFNILPFLHYHFQPLYKIWCKYINSRLNYNNFFNYGPHCSEIRFSKKQDGGRPPSWIFENLNSEHCRPIFRHCTKFGAKMLINAEFIYRNEIQNGGRHHLEFTSGGYF